MTHIIKNRSTGEALSQSFPTRQEATEWAEGAELSTADWEVTSKPSLPSPRPFGDMFREYTGEKVAA